MAKGGGLMAQKTSKKPKIFRLRRAPKRNFLAPSAPKNLIFGCFSQFEKSEFSKKITFFFRFQFWKKIEEERNNFEAYLISDFFFLISAPPKKPRIQKIPNTPDFFAALRAAFSILL